MDEPLETDEREEGSTEDECSDFECLPEGAGCVEIWEQLAENRESD